MTQAPLTNINFLLMSLASPKREKRKLAWSTLAGTWVVLAIFAWATGGMVLFCHIASKFFTGNLSELRAYGERTQSAPAIVATVVVMVPTMVTTIPLLSKVLGTSHRDTNRTKRANREFALHMLVLFGEEFIFRFLLLDSLRKILHLESGLSFFLLSFAGNMIWSALHLLLLRVNVKKWLLVLPVFFLGGVFFTMIYASYGFFASVLTHIIYDMVFFSVYCQTPFWWHKYILLCRYHLTWLSGMVLCLSTMSSHSLRETYQMLLQVSSQGDVLSGWRPYELFLVAILLTSLVSLLLELLWYDRELQKTEQEVKRDLLLSGVALLLSYPVLWGIEALLPGNFTFKVVGMAMLLVALEKTKSLSGIARLFWKSLLLSQLFSIVQKLDTVAVFSLATLFVIYQTGERVARYGLSLSPVRFLFIKHFSYWTNREKNPMLEWLLDRLNDKQLSESDQQLFFEGASLLLPLVGRNRFHRRLRKKYLRTR